MMENDDPDTLSCAIWMGCVLGFEIERSEETDWPMSAVPKMTSVVEGTMALLAVLALLEGLTLSPPHPDNRRHPAIKTARTPLFRSVSVGVIKSEREPGVNRYIYGPR